jgi:hypothetical protein
MSVKWYLMAGAIVLSAMLTPGAGHAATQGLAGQFWDVDSVTHINQARTIASTAEIARFIASGVDYPAGGATYIADTTSLATFLGGDAATLTGADNTTLEGSVFRFSGWIYLDAGVHAFSVGSDDGFELTVAGQSSRYENQRGFATTTFSGTFDGGWNAIELLYFENFGNSGLELRLDGDIVTAADTRTAFAAVSAVPILPAAPLLFAALGVLALLGRRTRAKGCDRGASEA